MQKLYITQANKMKFYTIFTLIFLTHITMLMAGEEDLDVHPFDYNSKTFESKVAVNGSPANQQIIDEENQAKAQFAMAKRKEIHQCNENARRKQFVFMGLTCLVRAAAIIQIADAQYHNKYGTALKIVAVAHALYGVGLLLEPVHKLWTQKNVSIASNEALNITSQMSASKNYALTGFGYVLTGVQGILFARAAPEDPLSPLATLFGASQLFVGGISCAYPGYLMFKDRFPFNKCSSNNDSLSYQLSSEEEISRLNNKKLERSRLQQFLNTGIVHAARGSSAFYLAHAMPSKQYADLLMTFGAFELLYGLCALYNPFVSAYHYLKGTYSNTPILEEGSRNFYILRALGFIALAPVNIIYTLGVPDAKTPWIIGVSALSVLVGIYSGWNPACDYCGFESLKCKKKRVFPSTF